MEKDLDNTGQPVNEKIEFTAYEDRKAPPELQEKSVKALRDKGLLNSAYHLRRASLKIAASILLFAGLFYGGWLLGRTHSSTPSTTSSSSDQFFLLLLYNPPGFAENAAHAKEYSDWMNSLVKNNQVVSGEELKDGGWQISRLNDALQVNNQAVLTGKGKISGFFLIKAADEKKAVEIAASCPHTKYKGMIELRPIQPQPGS